MYKRPISPNEIFHYGIKRRSGRYPYGSGSRPYQSNRNNRSKSDKLISSDDISKETFDKIKAIQDSLNFDEKKYLGEMSISKYTKYAEVLGNSYITLDEYEGEFRDSHPYDGLVVSIASGKMDRGSGNTDKLIKKAIEDSGSKPLIAEIDKDNSFSERLFIRNGFEKIDEIDDILFYRFEKKQLTHSSEREVNFKMNNPYYLSHGGPGSGRYPLGSGARPYQKLEGSRRGSGGVIGYIKSRKAKKVTEQQRKAKETAEKRRIEAEKEEARLEADKERVLRSGTPAEVMRYQGRLTNRELSEAAERIRLEKQLSAYTEKEVKTALDKMKTIQAYSNVGSALAKDGIEIWNSFAAIYNATDGGKDNPLPLISKGEGKKK